MLYQGDIVATITVEKGKNTDKKIDSSCGVCKRSTKHLIVTDASLKGYEDYDHDFYGWENEYQVVQCQGCETISFRQTHENSEDMQQAGPDPDDWSYAVQVDLYPNPEEGRSPLEDDHLLPQNLHRIYLETIRSLNSNLSVLAGIGVRAIVETVCKDKSASGGNLYAKINDLVSQGVLTQDGANILHKLRTLGNNAAHEVKPHSNVQLGLALDVIEHLLQGVYILPHHAGRTFT
jgi:hypothetical protein